MRGSGHPRIEWRTLSTKVKGTDNELVVASFWKDLDSSGHFEGANFDDAVVIPSTQKLLQSFDLKVEYFKTVVATGLLADAPEMA